MAPDQQARIDDAALRAEKKKRRDAIMKRVLLILMVPLVLLGLRTWRLMANLEECERLFPVVDQQIHQRKWDEAIVTCDRCLALNPLYYPAYEAKASLLVDQHKNDEALTTLLTGVKNIDDDPRMHRSLGQFYLETTREYGKAQEQFRIACRLDPSDGFSRALLQRADAKVAQQS